MIPEDNPEQLVQAGDGILADIWDTLRKEETTSSLDLCGLSIKVEFGEVYLDGYVKEENQPLVESTIHSVVGVVEVHNHLRTNDGILADIWDALWKEDAIRSLDMGSLSIEVKDGEVYLTGHLARENNLPLFERIAQSIEGVVAVHNNLIVDRDLIVQVAQALAGDEHTRTFILPVDAFHGWISLGGEVPTRELQHVAEKAAGEVAGVRGVIALPRVTGERQSKSQRAVQPRIGAAVYGENGEVGVVSQVVIQPDNRLVTHVVVRSKELRDINLIARENVVPVKDIDLVNDESILLVWNRRRLAKPAHALSTYTAFDPDEYPLALFNWKAPYPYTAGEVRWSLRKIMEVASQPGSQPETEVQVEIEGSQKLVMAQAGL